MDYRACPAPSSVPRPEAPLAVAHGTALILALAISFLGTSRSLLAQEVVVFTDYRSLVVSSHREAGPWVYLKVENGELAVQSSQIAEIRNEGPQAYVSARAVPPPMPVAADDHAVPASAPAAPALADLESPEGMPPPQRPPRGGMDGVNRPIGLRDRQVAKMGLAGGPGPNSVKR